MQGDFFWGTCVPTITPEKLFTAERSSPCSRTVWEPAGDRSYAAEFKLVTVEERGKTHEPV